ncbi:hypothetical protein ACFY4C_27485 [Actinomadura viridis]|uniref:hypothetical protein n=1 Tax=Actinomadura viridis TaxID=58110 RepID=UPI003692402E
MTNGTTQASPGVAETKRALAQEFPGWSVVYSSAGRWWAFRGPMPTDRMNETSDVDAGSPEGLRERLLAVEAGMTSGHGRHASADEDSGPFAPWDTARSK